ncbi:MAG: hypothetical protein HY320_15790 [Armatimonadetes bacterium]|nr:hypothetical protein [Armatimonadota bacterium]
MCHALPASRRARLAAYLCALLAAAFLTVLLAAGPAAAQVGVEATPAAGGFYRSGRWIGIRLQITNGGATQRVAPSAWFPATQMQMPPSSQDSLFLLPERLLPAGGARREWLYARGSQQDSLRNLVVRLEATGTPANQYPVNRVVVEHGDWVVLGVGRGAESLMALQGAVLKRNPLAYLNPPPGPPGPRPGAEERARIAVTDVDGLPDRWPGLDPVDTIVLTDVSERALSPEQRQALRDWLARGGHLVVTAGPDAARLRTPFFRELLPVEVQETTTLTRVAGLERYARQRGLGGPLVAIRSRPRPGSRVLAGTEEAPALCQRDFGMGRVTFLAIDPASPPFPRWPGAPSLWRRLLADHPREASLPPVYRTLVGSYVAYTVPLAEALFALPQLDPPNLGFIALFLLGYLICLVPLNQFFLRRWDRREVAWITTPLVVIVFTAGAYVLSYAAKGGQVVVAHAGIVQTRAGSPVAAHYGYVGLFSPARTRYQLAAEHGAVLGPPYWEEDRPGVRVLQGDSWLLDNLDVDMWAMRITSLEGVLPLGNGFRAALRVQGGQLRGSLTNDSGLSLRNCALLVGQQVIPVGNLAVGETLALPAVPPAPPSSSGAFPIQSIPLPTGSAPQARMAPALRDALAGLRPAFFAPQPGLRRPVLVGWVDRPLAEVRINHRPPAQSVGLYLALIYL